MKTVSDAAAIRELVLFADNDFQTYKYSIIPARDNLIRKVRRGVYDQSKAVRMFEHVAEYAARRYEKEFLRPGDWCRVFTAATRRCAAAELLAEYIDDQATA